jgi:hypothetical protein
LQLYRDACNHRNTDWSVYLGGAMTHANMGETDLARSYLNRAMARNPGLTMEIYQRIFSYPAWPECGEHFRTELETLVELGLPLE